MDHFGIGSAMKAMAAMYVHGARGTGRTTSLVESVKAGDRIVFAELREATRVERLLRERGVDVKCIVVPVREAERVFQRPPSEGRTIFDHAWVEQFYLGAIVRSMAELDHLERQASGPGAAHRETHRQAVELAKWRGW
jgi:hypothetical protein